MRRATARSGPFDRPLTDDLRDVVTIARAHHGALGYLRGTLAMIETLGRFVGLRRAIRRIGGGDAAMVDDAVAISVASFRSLERRLGSRDALGAVQGAIVIAGIEMMAAWVPDDRSLVALGQQVRVVLGDARTRGVYEFEHLSMTSTGIGWDMTACRYARLTRELGAPEVGSVFCAVDQPFVRSAVPDVAFTCCTTIAGGDDRCRFRIGDQV